MHALRRTALLWRGDRHHACAALTCTADALLEQLSGDASTLEVSVEFSIDELEPILEDMVQADEIMYSGGVVRVGADAYESEGSPGDMDTA